MLPKIPVGWFSEVHLGREEVLSMGASRRERYQRKMVSQAWFRSTVLWVMSPARFHCATLLQYFSNKKREQSYMLWKRFAGVHWWRHCSCGAIVLRVHKLLLNHHLLNSYRKLHRSLGNVRKSVFTFINLKTDNYNTSSNENEENC